MSTFQKVTIVGNLGDDPQTKVFDGGGQLSNISVATTETWRDKNTQEKQSLTEWHRIVLNGKLSELADKYLKKGDKVLIEGKLRTRKWQDNTGADRYSTEIVAREMTFLSSKGDRQAAGQSTGANQAPTSNIGDDDHDDLPF